MSTIDGGASPTLDSGTPAEVDAGGPNDAGNAIDAGSQPDAGIVAPRVISPGSGDVVLSTLAVRGLAPAALNLRLTIDAEARGSTQSDPSGTFEFKLEAVSQGPHVLQVDVLDSNETVIQSSTAIAFTVQDQRFNSSNAGCGCQSENLTMALMSWALLLWRRRGPRQSH